MNFLEKSSAYVARTLYWVAGGAIVAMMLITCGDVSLRYFRMGIPGTYELVYTLVLVHPGEYQVLPARAWEFYFPEVQGISAGSLLEILP